MLDAARGDTVPVGFVVRRCKNKRYRRRPGPLPPPSLALPRCVSPSSLRSSATVPIPAPDPLTAQLITPPTAPPTPLARRQSTLHKNREEPKQLHVLRVVDVRKGPRQQTPRGLAEMVPTVVINKKGPVRVHVDSQPQTIQLRHVLSGPQIHTAVCCTGRDALLEVRFSNTAPAVNRPDSASIRGLHPCATTVASSTRSSAIPGPS